MKRLTPDQVVAEMIRTIPVLHEEAERAMGAAVELTFQRLAEYAPHGATGELAHNVTHTVHKTADGVSGLVRPRAKYAGMVEGGTGLGKTLRGSQGQAYSASGRGLSAAEELSGSFDVMTAYGWGSKTPGKELALHVSGGVIFRRRVRGQRPRHFVQRTRESTVGEVETLLAAGAQRAMDRLF